MQFTLLLPGIQVMLACHSAVSYRNNQVVSRETVLGPVNIVQCSIVYFISADIYSYHSMMLFIFLITA